MSTQPCDQIAADIFEVQTELGCTLDYEEVLFLVAIVEQTYKPELHFEAILEETLDMYLCSATGPREAYKQVLGKVFGRRSAYKQKQDSRRGKYAPFGPR